MVIPDNTNDKDHDDYGLNMCDDNVCIVKIPCFTWFMLGYASVYVLVFAKN